METNKFVAKVLVAWAYPQFLVAFLLKHPEMPLWLVPIVIAVSFLLYVVLMALLFDPSLNKK